MDRLSPSVVMSVCIATSTLTSERKRTGNHQSLVAFVNRGGKFICPGPTGRCRLGCRTNWTGECQSNNPKVYKRVFSCSISDFFHPLVDPLNLSCWKSGVNGKRRILNCLTCTYNIPPTATRLGQSYATRPNWCISFSPSGQKRILQCLPKILGSGYPNVWLGTSVGCLKSLPKMDALRQVPVHPQAVRFVSHEPLLEDISKHVNYDGFGWVVAGGESGKD